MIELPEGLRKRAEDSISQLRAAVAEYRNVCYASSLGAESVVLTDLIWEAVPQIEIFSIDTGRLFPETYDLIERLQHRYGRTTRIYYPERGRVGGLGRRKRHQWLPRRHRAAPSLLRGPKGGAVPARRIRPRRLGDGHPPRPVAESRAGRPDRMGRQYGLHKVSPLLDWSGNGDLELSSAASGCLTTPCTTAVFRASAARHARAPWQPGEDSRSGRWWWERAGTRECGLHPRRVIPAFRGPAA